MRIDISFKYLEKSGLVDNILEKNIKKIERRVKIFKSDDPIHISVHIEKNPHKEEYFSRAHIYLPSRVLKSEAKGNKIAVAINGSFSALSKQLDKLKYRLEKHLQKNKNQMIFDAE